MLTIVLFILLIIVLFPLAPLFLSFICYVYQQAFYQQTLGSVIFLAVLAAVIWGICLFLEQEDKGKEEP